MPPDGPDSWPANDRRNNWLVFYRLDQMTFNGTGIIEGNGEQWWDLPCKPHRVTILTIHEFLLYINLMLNEQVLIVSEMSFYFQSGDGDKAGGGPCVSPTVSKQVKRFKSMLSYIHFVCV